MHSGSSTSPPRPAFIVNRNAGQLRRAARLVDAVEREIRGRADLFATANAEELVDAARHIVRSASPRVVLCGGDGTYLASITALAAASGGAALPEFVLVRSGTVSTVARNWSGPKDLLATVRRICEHPEAFVTTPRPTLAVTDGAGRQHVGFTFGTGLVASFFAEYERVGAGGNAAALRIVLRVFAESFTGGPFAKRILSPLPARVVVDGVPLAPSAWSLVVCSVLRDLGLHMMVTHRGGEDPARPHLVASPLPPRSLGPQWPLVALGRPLVGARNFDGLVHELSVEFPDEAGPYVLDGDMFRSKRVTVRAGPMIRVAT